MKEFVVCESIAAIVTHLREVTEEFPVKLSGHPFPRPKALCDMEVAWDTKIPVSSTRCKSCRALSGLTAWEG